MKCSGEKAKARERHLRVAYLIYKSRQVSEILVDSLKHLDDLLRNIRSKDARDEIAGDDNRLNVPSRKPEALEQFVAAVEDGGRAKCVHWTQGRHRHHASVPEHERKQDAKTTAQGMAREAHSCALPVCRHV